MVSRRNVAILSLLVACLAAGGAWRYLQVMPVGSGETRGSPDGRFTASVTDWSERSFLTGTPRRWFEYRLEGPGARHDLIGNPIPGPFFGSRSAHRVIRWSEDGSFVDFVFPDATLRITTGAGGGCPPADLAGYETERTASGFRIRPLGWRTQREVREMTVSLHPPGEATPGLGQRRRVGADIVRYALARESGGSGGDEVTLRAERAMATGILRFEWRGQAEDGGEPDLTEAWDVMASVDCGT